MLLPGGTLPVTGYLLDYRATGLPAYGLQGYWLTVLPSYRATGLLADRPTGLLGYGLTGLPGYEPGIPISQ